MELYEWKKEVMLFVFRRNKITDMTFRVKLKEETKKIKEKKIFFPF